MLFLLSLLLACVLVCVWVRWRVRHRRLLVLAARLPGPPALPLLGNALTFNVRPEDVLKVFDNLKQKYGRAFKFWLGPDLNFCISEPNDVKILLESNEASTRGPQYKYIRMFLGYGILSGSGPVWRKLRKVLTPSYGIKAIVNYSHVFNGETHLLLERLRIRPVGQSFNIYEELVKTTTYIICQTLFGLTREQTLKLPHLQQVVDQTHQMYTEAFMRMVTWYLQIDLYYWLSQYHRRHQEFIKKWLLVGDAVVKHRLKKLEAMGLIKKDDSCNEDNENIADLNVVDRLILSHSTTSYEEILKQLFAVFTTSQETSANIGCFLLLMLANHPECQEKLYLEIRSVFGESDRDVTDEDMRRMPYLDMVVKETIRLFPAACMVQRTITEDIDISHGITLPAGSSLVIPIFHIHRDPDFWPEPDAFDPERFTPEGCASRHPGSYIPFSLGPINCLGRQVFTKLVKTMIIRILREFRVSSPETYADLKLLCAISVESVNGFPVILHPRLN